ncbi:GspE/PulE family protein [Thiomicrorhabdus aquaedulcis]|uniref:GspE/PulE family protein n=1 Tax=Thiomicrorhabdus aquaedulcis TaxID=2211106 RepID=UPI000FDA5412|nr:ATPase, T2SS/T4P/T4SS family [Thiomicrorhabdus aquaedulcis]
MFNDKHSLFIEKILIEKEIITENQLEMAKHESLLRAGLSVPDAIAILGFASEIKILRAVSAEMGIPSENVISKIPLINDKAITFNYNLAESVSKSRGQCLFDLDETKNKVLIAITDPSDPVAHLKTKGFYKKHGFEVEYFVVTKLSLSLLQRKMYVDNENYREKIYEMLKGDHDKGEGINDFISLMFEYAALERSSDIFINYSTTDESLSYVFFRIDRKKKFQFALPKDNAKRLVQAIKQRAGMEAGKIRGHQDGSLEVKILQDKYILSIRVSSITTVSGEQITLRIQMEDRFDLETLGFEKHHADRVKKIIKGLKGIIVLSGVTGSGKTTTLYSMLSELDADAYNIITMEDPVEIRIKNINQVQINEDAGQSFSQTIRSILRQAPDAILLGEIRDAETASRAVEMALTGHLVLTTIHANGIGAVRDRLEDLKVGNIEAFIKATGVMVHQELVPSDDREGLKLRYEIGFNGLTEIETND